MAGRTIPRKSSDSRTNQSLPRSEGLKRLTANPGCTVCARTELAEHERPRTTSTANSARNQAIRQGWNAKPTILFAFAGNVKRLPLRLIRAAGRLPHVILAERTRAAIGLV